MIEKDAIVGRKAPKTPTVGPYLIHLELLRDRVKSFEKFPYCLPAVRPLELLEFHPKVTFLVGENGSGKSTILEALAVAMRLNPEGGSRNFNFATRASHADFGDTLRVARKTEPRDAYFLRAESFYNVATQVDEIGPDALPAYNPPGELRSLHERSHGESFFALFCHRFRGNGLYLMDEPEAALSPRRQLEFLAILNEYCKKGGQFVIATHSPILMAYPDARIYVLGEHGIRETSYEDTDHYLVTRGFLVNPKRVLGELLSEPDEPK